MPARRQISSHKYCVQSLLLAATADLPFLASGRALSSRHWNSGSEWQLTLYYAHKLVSRQLTRGGDTWTQKLSSTSAENPYLSKILYGPDPVSGTAVGQWNKTYTFCGSRQTLISPSDSALRQIWTAQARFLSDTTHSPMATSKSVCRWTVPHCCRHSSFNFILPIFSSNIKRHVAWTAKILDFYL